MSPLRTDFDNNFYGKPMMCLTSDIPGSSAHWPPPKQLLLAGHRAGRRDICADMPDVPTRQGGMAIASKYARVVTPPPLSEEPWDSISMDFITELPRVDGHNAILMIVDRFSKYVMLLLT